jgi:N-acetylglucosaminyl-diphospho-decaprenol L-rhamnosyltransferase
MPLLAAIVVHWHDEARLANLVAAWPRDDPRFELVVVDNSGSAPGPPGTASGIAERLGDFRRAPDDAPAPSISRPTRAATSTPAPVNLPAAPAVALPVRLLRPGRNLGFAGGINAGVAASRAPLLLLLNPDALLEPGALDRLLAGFAAHPEAAGLAPRLAGEDGEPQFAWQLRRLPSAWGCLRQTLPWPAASVTGGTGGSRRAGDGSSRRASGGSSRHAIEPPPGAPVEQPAAAALALRREALLAAGGLDEQFHPAWFEDVDLARRLRQAGARLLYWPAARFTHALGSTVPRLGYGRFLWIYHRNLERYLAKHHGAAWALASRVTLAAGLLLRLPLTALRRPHRAASRREGAAGLLVTLAGVFSGWRLPRRLAADPSGDRTGFAAGERAGASLPRAGR